MNRKKAIQLALSWILLGVLADFIVGGVLKIIWFSIYGSVYMMLAAGFYNSANENKKWHPYAPVLAIAFLFGTVLGHWGIKDTSQHVVYSMTVTGYNPVTLQTPELPDTLQVISARLDQEIGSSQKSLSVAVSILRNYGCIVKYQIDSVAGVDIIGDPQARWVWKSAGSKPAPEAWPIWCRIRWF